MWVSSNIILGFDTLGCEHLHLSFTFSMPFVRRGILFFIFALALKRGLFWILGEEENRICFEKPLPFATSRLEFYCMFTYFFCSMLDSELCRTGDGAESFFYGGSG